MPHAKCNNDAAMQRLADICALISVKEDKYRRNKINVMQSEAPLSLTLQFPISSADQLAVGLPSHLLTINSLVTYFGINIVIPVD